MIIETAKFKKSLTTIMPGIEQGKVTTEGADLVIFNGDKMLSYNGKVAVSIPFDIGGKSAGVKAKDAYNLVAKLKEDSMDISIDESEHKIKIKCGKLKASLNLQDITFIEKLIAKMKFGEEKNLPENFVDATKVVAISDNKTSLKGFAIGKVDGRTMLISTDKVRISASELSDDMDQCLINDDLITSAVTFGKPTAYSIVGPWFHLGYEGGMHFSILRSDDSSFPFEKMGASLKRCIDMEGKVKFSFPTELAEVVDRVTTLASTDSNAKLVCKLKIESDKITVIGEKNTGSAEEEIGLKNPIQVDSPIIVNMPVKTLLALADKSTDCKVVELSATCTALVISNKSYTMVASCSSK